MKRITSPSTAENRRIIPPYLPRGGGGQGEEPLRLLAVECIITTRAIKPNQGAHLTFCGMRMTSHRLRRVRPDAIGSSVTLVQIPSGHGTLPIDLRFACVYHKQSWAMAMDVTEYGNQLRQTLLSERLRLGIPARL